MNTHVNYLLDRVIELETKVVALEEENEIYEGILKEIEEKGLLNKCMESVVDIDNCIKDFPTHACCGPQFLVPCNTPSSSFSDRGFAMRNKQEMMQNKKRSCDLNDIACLGSYLNESMSKLNEIDESSKTKVYISGKISGLDIADVKKKFEMASFFLSQTGFEPVSPFDNGLPAGLKWEDYMMADLAMLKECDAIFMLRDWKDSVGAKIERKFAKKMGLEIYYEG